MTLLALCVVRRCQFEAVVLEVGLGGRLDATDIVRPVAALIRPIELEHYFRQRSAFDFRSCGRKVLPLDTPATALALLAQEPSDYTLVCGSFYLVGEVLEQWEVETVPERTATGLPLV